MSVLKILAIDPGVNKPGFSILELDEFDNITVLFTETIEVNKLLKYYPGIVENHGEKFAKICIISERVKKLLLAYCLDIKDRINYVVCEEAYYAGLVQPFKVLVEITHAIKHSVYEYDSSIPFQFLSASKVKQNLGVSGNSPDKTLVKTALAKRDINFPYHDFTSLGPDAVDSIAIGVYACDILTTQDEI